MNLLQRKASDPSISSWVSASAGTGKTKILTDRVLRLFLEDVPFEKILCLTFTNAAASEMSERILSELEKWSQYSSDTLEINLNNLLGYKPTTNLLNKAHGLFATYVATQKKINIYTIHSYCQKILKSFPLEANLSPSFKIMDEIKASEIISSLQNQLFKSEGMEECLKFLSHNFHEITIKEIFREIIAAKTKILQKTSSNRNYSFEQIPELIKKLQYHFQEKESKFIQEISNAGLMEFFNELSNTYINSNYIKAFFLTQSGELKKRIVPKKIAEPNSPLYKQLETLQERIFILDQQLKYDSLTIYSRIIELLAEKIIIEYEVYKKQNSLVDYEDLIVFTKNLLTNTDVKQWVLYKLDGGIDHLLVDEAQDTSKHQWEIIEALIQEFYSNNYYERSKNRTIFIVGDEKQSIFSFQGADIESFAYMNEFLKHNFSLNKLPFENIELDTSYRCTEAIVKLVYDVFNGVNLTDPDKFPIIPRVKAHRNNYYGKVELWPLTIGKLANEDDLQVSNNPSKSISKEISLENSAWSIKKIEETRGRALLARQIAAYIKQELQSGRILPSTQKPVSPADFMILFRTRDEFTNDVVDALRENDILTGGLDRIALLDDLGVLDLLSIAKFVICSEDELNLAALLKSPLIGFNDSELHEILQHSKKNNMTLWEYLNADEHFHLKTSLLRSFINIYKTFPIGDFFFYISEVADCKKLLNDSKDAINEFLALYKNYTANYSLSLVSFITWFEHNEIVIKRDSDNRQKVRIMTIHASKGLQAPIVILGDTTRLPTNSDLFVWDDNNRLLSVKTTSEAPEFYKKLKLDEQEKTYREYLRLLYVGMTRAEDELIICGHQGANKVPQNCWYEIIRQSMTNLASICNDDKLILTDDTSMAPHTQVEQPISSNDNLEPSYQKEDLAFWRQNSENILKSLLEKTAYNTNTAKITSTENFHIQERITSSGKNKHRAMEYGIIIHKILDDAIGSHKFFLAREHPLISNLAPSVQKRIFKVLTNLEANNEFLNLLQTNEVKTELAFGYPEGSEVKIGRIDLLLIGRNEITIIDYKSDLVTPNENEQIPETYLSQLDFYARAIKEIYSMPVICKILWLETGKLQDANPNPIL